MPDSGSASVELERLAGPVVALCRRPLRGLRAPGEPKVGNLVLKETELGPIGMEAAFRGQGFDIDRAGLRTSTFGEAVERYSIMDVDGRPTRRASVAELKSTGVPHLPPAQLLSLPPGVSRLGNLAHIPASGKKIQWVEGVDLATGTATLLPAIHCICFGNDPGNPLQDEGRWCIATSNGAATGPGPTEACLSGLYELLERDAFMLMWYHKLRFPYITWEPSSRLAHRAESILTGCRLDYRLIDLSEINEVPTVVGVVRGTVAGEVQYAVGGGSGGRLTDAVWRALREALSFYSMQRRDLLAIGVQDISPEQIRGFSEHGRYYTTVDNQRELEFLFEDRPSRTLPVDRYDRPGDSPQRELRRLVEHLSARRFDLYATDLTPPELAEAGLFTYKVVSPQLMPLDADHQARHLTNERLLNEPTRRGWRTDRPELADLNHAPHPFP